jgi:DNA-binding HxlR family transcriptional regulator
MVDESEPLAFLEKSHCASILLVLYRKGIMCHNELFAELGETYNVVVKRINFLVGCGLVSEYVMVVRPFRKDVKLTDRGLFVASKLEEIERILKEW